MPPSQSWDLKIQRGGGVAAPEGPDASMPPTGPGDLKGVEDCGAARNGEVGLPGKFACSFPLGCIFT